MRNLIILGSGRSGTSAVAGLFRSVPNVFYGYEFLAPSENNPKGYFEDEVVNAINNILIRQMTGTALLDLLPGRLLPFFERYFSWMHRDTRSLWIARPRRPLKWRLGYDLAHLIGKIAAHHPFCLKDPRFSFTLPLWRPYLPDGTRFLVVFRDPVRTVQSMLSDSKRLYERPLALTESWAIDHWNLAYKRIIEQRQAHEADDLSWLFVDIADVVSGVALPAIEAFAESPLDAGHIEAQLLGPGRSRPAQAIEQKCASVMDQLRLIAKEDLIRLGQQRMLNGP